jgi:MFS family permease
MIIHAFTIGVLAVGSSLISNFLEVERGISASLVSILSSGAAVGTVTFGFLVARHARLRRAPIVAASIACGLTAMGYMLLATQTWLPLIALALVCRGGLFSTWSLFLGVLGSIAPAHLRPRSFAIMEILGGSAMSFGPIVASQLWKIDPRTPFIVSAICAIVMVIVLVGTRQRQELTVSTESAD